LEKVAPDLLYQLGHDLPLLGEHMLVLVDEPPALLVSFEVELPTVVAFGLSGAELHLAALDDAHVVLLAHGLPYELPGVHALEQLVESLLRLLVFRGLRGRHFIGVLL